LSSEKKERYAGGTLNTVFLKEDEGQNSGGGRRERTKDPSKQKSDKELGNFENGWETL